MSHVVAPEWKTLLLTVENPTGVAKVSDEELIAATQNLLRLIGYNVGPAKGRISLDTTVAIASFQSQQKMVPDGQPSGALLLRLSDVILHRALDNMAAAKRAKE